MVILAAAVAVTWAVLAITGTDPLAAATALFRGALGSWIKFSHVINVWLPLTLCSCGLLYTFRIGLWNIGVEGQVMLGAIFATWVLRSGIGQSPPLVLTLAFAAAFLGGGCWAALTGWLKVKGGVHEIFAGLGMNFVAQATLLWLIFGPWRRPGVASMSGTELLPRELWLPFIPSLRLSPAGIAIAVAAFALTALILRHTRFGLRLKAIGRNQTAAVLVGIHVNRHLAAALVIAGGLAGLAGCLQVSGVYHRLLPAISSGYGYLALLVVMLANYNARLVPLVAFFFACLNVGSIQLPMVLQVDSSLSGVIQGTLVLTVLAVHAARRPAAPAKHRPSEPSAPNGEGDAHA